MPDKIAILGGTFDPVHFGHLRLATDVQQALALDQVLLMPSHQPAHREPTHVSAEHRLAMLELAVAAEPTLKIDDREFHRTGPTYTIDTLKSLRQDYPDAALSLILGSDAFIQLNQWHDWENILNYCHLIVANRPHYPIPAHSTVQEKLSSHFTQNKNDILTLPFGKIFFQTIHALDISGTAIRQQLAKHQNPRYLLPESVYHYIIEHQLYS